MAGDFNSVSPHDDEPSNWAALPRHHRSRYLSRDARTADRRILQQLHDAGYVDIAHRLDGHRTPTVPGASFRNTEFIPFRSDYFLATEALADRATAYAVLKDDRAGTASDHYPIIAEFNP